MRFGIATADITPPFRTLMHGYSARKDYYDGVNDPLTFTAVVLEEGERRMLLGAADICMFHNDGSMGDILREAAEIVGCPADNVMLNASHTHGGPMIPTNLICFAEEARLEATKRYGDFLREKVMAAAAQARAGLAEGTLWYAEGRTNLPMNRRPTRDGGVPNAPNPDGPTDNRLPLLVLKDAAGRVAAIGGRVACHPVATGAQHLLTADYPGAWRAALRQAFGGTVTPFFLQGAGADTRPRQAAAGDKWRVCAHAELAGIGWELCAETLTALTAQPLQPVTGLTLAGTVKTVSAPCAVRYTTRAELEGLRQTGGVHERTYAEACMRRLEAGEAMPDHAEFTVQTLWLNEELALIGLSAEPLLALGYAVEKAVAPKRAVLLGYTNGYVAYTPDRAEMARGGYETTSYLFGGWSGPLLPGLEDLFAGAVVPKSPEE